MSFAPTDPIDANSVDPQALESSSDCFELPPADPNAYTFTGQWEPHNYAVFFISYFCFIDFDC
jgi:hypothetical protein